MEKFTSEIARDIDEMLEISSVKLSANLRAVMIFQTGGIPMVSQLSLILALIETMVNANDDMPEFQEYIRTKLLTAIAPK